MKTIVLHEPGRFDLIDVAPPQPPGRDEVQARVLRVGICGTDLHAFAGRQPFFSYPRILGHELALEITEIGPTSTPHQLRIGGKYAFRPYLNCDTCAACRRGNTNCCMSLQVFGVHVDGGMRELINVPSNALHGAPSLIDDELALVEMLSIGAHAVRRAQLRQSETVLVVGLGPIGLSVCQFARLAGARVIGMDINNTRLAFARQQGIVDIVDATNDPVEQLQALLPDDLPTVVFDATGNGQSMMNAFRYVAHGGRLVFVGLFQGDVTFHDPDFHRRELTLLASRNATAQDFQQVMAALERGYIHVQSWITHRFSPEQLVAESAGWPGGTDAMVKGVLSF